MLPYWLVFLTFALGAVSRRFEVNRTLGPVLIAALLGLWLFVGLRYRVGADWGGYALIYRESALQTYDQLAKFGDRGFYTVVWALNQIGAQLWLLNLICASIFMFGLARFAREMPNPWLTLCIALPYLVFVVAMSGIRQAAAIGFFYLAIVAYRDKRLLVAVAWLLAAASFHASAIVMMGVAGLSFSRNKLQATAIIGLTAAVAYYALSSSFDTYSFRYSARQVESSGTIYRLIMNLLAAIPYLFLSKRFPVMGDHEQKFWRNMSWLAVFCLPALAVVRSSTALDRFALYLFPLQTYVLSWLPRMWSREEKSARTWTIVVLVYSAAILFVFLGYGVNAKSSIPYRFYLLSGD